jgi:D-alanine transaminase
MTVVYLNGQYIPDTEAKVSVFDRGFLFGDSVYEVIPFYAGKPLGERQHLARLKESLRKTEIQSALSSTDWLAIFNTLLEKNELTASDARIYLQISRGSMASRQHAIPEKITPTVFATVTPAQRPSIKDLEKGVSLVTVDDFRWHQNHIKATALLGNILQLQHAMSQKADDAILVRDGFLTESTASNVFIVKDNVICTPVADKLILHGITRAIVLNIAKQLDIPTEERAISFEELRHADEIWLTGSSKEIVPVLKLDGETVGTGQPGAVWQQIIKQYHELREHPELLTTTPEATA